MANRVTSYHCKCKVEQHLLKCNPLVNKIDICFFCKKDQCGQEAIVLHFTLKDAICLDKPLIKCCPKIKTIILDDERLCSCYCSMKGVTVLASGTTGFAYCKAW